MRMKLVVMMVAGLALAGCETTSDDKGAASGTGQAAGSGTSSVDTSGLASRGNASTIRPGTQEDLVVNVGDRVFFATDSFQLSAEARDLLERQAAWLRQNPSVTLTVEGHADERGTRDYNIALGERRATAVRDYLVALGINPNRIRTISYGKERPVDARSVPEAWAKNRRGVSVVR